MRRVSFIILLLLLVGISFVSAQTDYAGTLEVLDAGVEVQRVDTANRISIGIETIIGVGDTIFTDDTGRARITFFADGTTTELDPNTTYRIEEFTGEGDSFTIRVSVLLGITHQQLGRALDANSAYEVNTPGMTLAARGTVFDVRVEANDRSAMIVRESDVQATDAGQEAGVPTGFGIRSERGGDLSDVVRATSFDELDSALDGCSVTVSTIDDVAINVRSGPSLDNARVGFVDANSVVNAMGVSEAGNWYRVPFAGSYGWFLSSSLDVTSGCAGLRVFANDHAEDLASYTGAAALPLAIDPATAPEPEATPEADSETDSE